MSANEDDTPTLLLRGAASGMAARILTTHLLIALIQKGVMTPSELNELLDASRAFAEDLGESREVIDLVLQSLDLGSGRRPEGSGGLQ